MFCLQNKSIFKIFALNISTVISQKMYAVYWAFVDLLTPVVGDVVTVESDIKQP